MRLRSLFIVALLCTTPAFAGCLGGSLKTNVSPAADIANAGGKIEETGHAIFQAAKDSHAATPNLIPEIAVDNVAIAVNKLGHVGLTLEASLRAYNAAKAAGSDLTAQRLAVSQALNVVTSAMNDIGKAIPPGTLQTIDSLVTQVLSIVASVKAQVLL